MVYSKPNMIHDFVFEMKHKFTHTMMQLTSPSATTGRLFTFLILLIVPFGHFAQVTKGQGEGEIANGNGASMKCGLRHFQDMISTTPTAKGHHTVVNVVNGNMIHMREDLFIPGVGLPLRILFTYNSSSTLNDGYGYGWQMNYNVRYAANSTNGTITIVRPDERRDLFVPEGNGSFTSGYGVRDELLALETGYKLTVWRDLYNNQGDYAEYYFDSPDHPYVTRIVDRNGNTLSFGYNDETQLITVSDDMGRTVRLQYEGNKLSTILDPAGRAFTYSYSGDGLTRYANPADGGFTYVYADGLYDMTEITDTNGNTYAFSYENGDAVSQVVDPLGQTIFTFQYGEPEEGMTTMSDSKGDDWVFTYDASKRVSVIKDPLDHTQSRTWDENYRMVASVDGDQNQTTYGYDSHSNLTLVTNALGHSIQMQYEPTYQRLASVEDAKGQTRRNEYDAQGNLVGLTNYMGDRYQFAYDDKGRLETMTDPLGHQTQYTYDAFGHLIQARDALGGESNLSYDDLGRITQVTDAKGNQTHYEYDLLGRIVQVTDALNGKSQFIFDPVGNVISITGPTGSQVKYLYDKLNRMIEKSDPVGSRTTYQHDPSGNITHVTVASRYTIQYGYDALGRCIRVVDPLGHEMTYTYNAVGQVASHTDANGNTTNMTYDPAHQLVQVTDAMGGITTFAYDPSGNMISRTDAGDRTYHYEYNAASQCISQVWPSGRTWLYSYDPMRRMISKTDPKGVVTQYKYDPLGRLIQSKYPEGDVDWSYDAVDNLTGINNGLSLGETTSCAYDPLNRLITSTVDYPGFMGEQTVRYEYDAAGNQTSLIYPDGQVANYTYDAANRRIRVQSVDGTTTYAYDDAGNLQSITYSNGMVAAYQYDAMGRPSSLRLTSAAGANLIDRQYTFDPVGNKLTESHGEDNSSRTLTYDALNRLIEAVYRTGNQTETHSYTYGPANERLTKTVNGNQILYTYDADGLLTEENGPEGAVAYTYDERGNRVRKATARQVWDYIYDSQNQLVSAKLDDVAGFFPEERGYAYTATGQRAMVSDYGWPTYFVYAGHEVIVEQGSDWKISYNPGLAMREEDMIAYAVYDHSGTSVVEIWPEGGWKPPFHLVDFDEFGIKRKGSSEILTAFASSILDPFTHMYGSFGYDPFTNLVSRRVEEQLATQYSPLGSALANYNASAAYVNSLRETNPIRYNQLLPMLQQQQQQYIQYYTQYQQRVANQLLSQAIAQRQAELERDRRWQEEMDRYHREQAELSRQRQEQHRREAQAFRAQLAQSSSVSSRTLERIDQGFTVLGDAGSIGELFGKLPGASWGVAAIQFIYQSVTGRVERNTTGTIPLITPVGVFNGDTGGRVYNDYRSGQGGI